MSYADINQTVGGDNETEFQDFSVDRLQTDGPTGVGETSYICTDADLYLGYYKQIPELHKTIDIIAMWTVGKGFKADDATILATARIRGNGKDTFNKILGNHDRVKNLVGDAYAEIITDKSKNIINLKPLDPAAIKVIMNEKGIIIRYEQVNKLTKKTIQKWSPEQIFHSSRNRYADECHGTGVGQVMKDVMDARGEAIADYRKLLHRNVYPVRIWQLDTDDEDEIAQFKNTVAKAKYEGEDIYVPKGNLQTELATVPINAITSPIPWIQILNGYFYQDVGVPQILVGGGQELNQVSSMVEYLSWEQTVEYEQLGLEEDVEAQLGIKINLEFPASLQNNMLNDNRKDGSLSQQLNKPSNMNPRGTS